MEGVRSQCGQTGEVRLDSHVDAGALHVSVSFTLLTGVFPAFFFNARSKRHALLRCLGTGVEWHAL